MANRDFSVVGSLFLDSLLGALGTEKASRSLIIGRLMQPMPLSIYINACFIGQPLRSILCHYPWNIHINNGLKPYQELFYLLTLSRYNVI